MVFRTLVVTAMVAALLAEPAQAFPVEPAMSRLAEAYTAVTTDLYPDAATAGQAAVTASRIALNAERIGTAGFPAQGRYIVVNIPSMELRAYENGVLALSSPVVVGHPETPTPVMVSDLTAIKFNPDWTVPRSIAEPYVEKLRRSQFGYFRRKGIVAKRGRETVPVNTVNPDTFFADGYRFWQPPGDRNSLGRLKFELDNAEAIYLHDTNEPKLFAEAARARSHGCVRVQHYRELAAWVGRVSVADVEAGIGAGRTAVTPVERVPVFFTYFTVLPDATGTIRLFDDIYRLDAV